MATTRIFLVDVVTMYAMITNRESRGIVPLVLSQTPDYQPIAWSLWRLSYPSSRCSVYALHLLSA